MGGDAKSTYIVNGEDASLGFARALARAELMGERITGITARITAAEAGRPWGTTGEFGKPFEENYHAGGGGAEFVRSQVHVLSDGTAEGMRTGNQAMAGSLQLDQDGAKLFRSGDAAAVNARMKRIGEEMEPAENPNGTWS